MKTEYTYDKANCITAVSTPLGVQSVFYDFAGRVVKSANNATGAEKLIEYDGRGLVSHIKTVADGKTIFEENNTYDKLGNKTISVENGITTKYRYDGMNRLTSVIKGENETVYDFDCYNNIEKKYELFLDNKSITRYHYDSANRLVMSENGTNAVHYEYDDSGNMTKKTDNNGSIRYSYDGFNRLKSVAFGENVTEYAYTPEGFRSKKTVNGSTTRYLYDGANICAEVIPDGTAYTYYRADGIIGSVHGDEKLYYSQTSRGDVSVVYDTAGNVVKSNTYSPYGERKTVQKVNDTNDPLRLMWVAETEKIHIPFGYCGEYTDDETGFVYLRNRYYDPEVGRFITEDPIRDGVNWYVYAGNNPIVFTDPNGLDIYYFVNKQFAREADWNKNYLMYVQDEPVHILITDTRDEFIAQWNAMGSWAGKDVEVSLVVINMHGSPGSLSPHPDGSTGIITANDVDDGTLVPKYIGNILILGCNSGHFDHKYDSVANRLLVHNAVKSVIASDGTVSSRTLIGNYKSKGDKTFKKYTTTTNEDRKNKGFIKYTKNKNGELEWKVLGKKINVSTLFKKKKKVAK